MISNPWCGWCKFQLGDFVGHPSYITEVPVDLLSAFISNRETGSGSAYLDEEGNGGFTFVLSHQIPYIIEDNCEDRLHVFQNIDFEDLEKELMQDVYENLDEWADFCSDMEDDLPQRKSQLINLLEKLEEIRTKTYGLEPVFTGKEETQEDVRAEDRQTVDTEQMPANKEKKEDRKGEDAMQDYTYFECVHSDTDERGNLTFYIDGYPNNEEGAGMVIATVTVTPHNDIYVDWHHNGYRMNDNVLGLINNDIIGSVIQDIIDIRNGHAISIRTSQTEEPAEAEDMEERE